MGSICLFVFKLEKKLKMNYEPKNKIVNLFGRDLSNSTWLWEEKEYDTGQCNG